MLDIGNKRWSSAQLSDSLRKKARMKRKWSRRVAKCRFNDLGVS